MLLTLENENVPVVVMLANGTKTLNGLSELALAGMFTEKVAMPPGPVSVPSKSIVVPVPTCRKSKSTRKPFTPPAVRLAPSPAPAAL